MRFWFDTEFYEDGETIRLISIGVVSGDDREYYAETSDAKRLAGRNPWLRQNVLPHLIGAPRRQRSLIAADLIKFMGEKPEIWAYYAAYDWVVLCQLFGRMIDLPKGWPMYCRDLKQAVDRIGNPALPKQNQLDGPEHNALSDARWTKRAWNWLAYEYKT